MDPEELKKIILHAVPNSWKKKDYIQVWDSEGRPYKDTRDMFDHMEIVESIYEGGSPSKNTQQAESNHASLERKKKGEAPPLPSNPKKGRTGKRKRNDAGHTRDAPTGTKNTCLLHGPGHSLEDCKVLK